MTNHYTGNVSGQISEVRPGRDGYLTRAEKPKNPWGRG